MENDFTNLIDFAKQNNLVFKIISPNDHDASLNKLQNIKNVLKLPHAMNYGPILLKPIKFTFDRVAMKLEIEARERWRSSKDPELHESYK